MLCTEEKKIKEKMHLVSVFFFTERRHTVAVAIRYLLPLLLPLSHAIITVYWIIPFLSNLRRLLSTIGT